MLECRLTPAVNYWLGGDGQFTTAANWSDGVPTADDDLIFNGSLVQSQFPTFGIIATALPLDTVEIPIGEGPPAPPTSPPVSNPNLGVTFSDTVGTLYGSIHVVNGYSGTVTIPFDITFGGFEQTTGAINQESSSQSAANTLSVSAAHSALGSMGGAFSWTGGVLNSGENAGVVRIVGLTNATIGNGSDMSYTTGSDLKLLSGTTLSASGSIVLNNGAGLEVGVGCSFDTLEDPNEPLPMSPPQPPANPQPAARTWADLIAGVKGGAEGQFIEGIGMILLKGDAAGFGRVDAPVWVTGGKLNVTKRDMHVTKWFATNPTGQPANPALGTSMYVSDGSVVVADGRTLKVAERLLINGSGLLTTQVDAEAQTHIAVIDGDLTVNGGTVQLGINIAAGNHVASILKVTKDVKFFGGTYKPHVRATSNTECDLWMAEGKFEFRAVAKVDPIVYGVLLAPPPGQNGDGVGLSWQVVYTKAGFVNATKPTTSVAADWAIDKGSAAAGDPIQWESLKVNRLR